MSIKLESKERRVGLQDVSQVESRLGVKFPKDYLNFLLNFNVAIPDSNQYVTSSVTTSVDVFFGIHTAPTNDLFEQNHVVFSGRLADKVLAIARAGGGNLICLNLADGSVYLWDHELEAAEDETPGFDNMKKLSNSFEGFLDALQARSMDSPADARVMSVELKPGFSEKFKKFM